MTEEIQQKDIARYRTIALAPELIEQKNMGALEETLLSFQKGIGVEVNEDTRDSLRMMFKHPQFLQEYIGNFVGKYQKELYTSTLKELKAEYSDLFAKFYDEKNLPKVYQLFDSDITYGKIMEKYNSLKEKADSKTNNFNDEQKKKAKVELEELSKIVDPLQAFESLKIKALEGPIEETSLRNALNFAYEEKSQQEYEQAA